MAQKLASLQSLRKDLAYVGALSYGIDKAFDTLDKYLARRSASDAESAKEALWMKKQMFMI